VCDSAQVLERTQGGEAGSVLAYVDHCASPGGKRQLRAWLARPLRRIDEITARQDAVAALAGPLAAGADAATAALRRAGDVERAVVRFAAAAAGAVGRDAPRVVLYEDAARRKLRAVTALLRGLAAVQEAADALLAAARTVAEGGPQALPPVLRALLTYGERLPDFREALQVRGLARLVQTLLWPAALVPRHHLPACTRVALG
jgi:DNA mismatch repair protein MSH6